MILAAASECPQAELTAIALEYGTLPGLKVLKALRADQWLANNPGVPADRALRIHRQLRDAFYVDEDGWKRQVLAQAGDAARQALVGLGEAQAASGRVSR